MKKLLLIVAFLFLFSLPAAAQSCPAGSVCLAQAEANRLFDQLSKMVSLQDAFNKLLAERGTTDVALAQAQKVIASLTELDAVNGRIILKQKEMFGLYQQVIDLQAKLIEDLEKRLMKPKSTWDKIWAVLKRVGDVLIGVGIGVAIM